MPPTGEQDAPVRRDLSQIAHTRRLELRLSLRAVETRTIDPSTGEPLVKYGWLNRLEKGERVTPPQLPELSALADALELPLEKLQDAAAAQFFGMQTVWSASGEARAFIAQTERLTPQQREQLRRLLDTFTAKGGEPDG
jgi:hypothetical protein